MRDAAGGRTRSVCLRMAELSVSSIGGRGDFFEACRTSTASLPNSSSAVSRRGSACSTRLLPSATASLYASMIGVTYSRYVDCALEEPLDAGVLGGVLAAEPLLLVTRPARACCLHGPVPVTEAASMHQAGPDMLSA